MKKSLLFVLAVGLLIAAEEKPKPDEPKEFEPALVKMKPLAADPKDDELHKLLKERFNAALGELDAAYKHALAGQLSTEKLFDAATRVKRAGLEAFDDPREQVALLEKYNELARHVEKLVDARYRAGRVAVEELERARYNRADAEIALLRHKEKAAAKPK